MHGYGVMYYPDQTIYKGTWVDGRKDGAGELTMPDGEIITGMWEKGQFVFIPVAAIAIAQKGLTLTEGEQAVQLSLTILPFDATDQRVEWQSSKPDVAYVDQEGLVNPLAPGVTEITAIALAEGFEAVCPVRVRPARVVPVSVSVQSLRIDPPYLTIDLNSEPVTLRALILPANATNKTVLWSSENPDVATVDLYRGLLRPQSIGLATITAKTEDGGYTAISFIQVRAEDEFPLEEESFNQE